MNTVRQETIVYFKVTTREPSAVFWSYLFPIVALLSLRWVFSNGLGDGPALLAGSICMVTMTGSLYGVGVCFVALREEGILKRFLVTPVSLWKIVLGLCLSQMVVVGLISTSLFFIAEIFFRTFPSTKVGKLILVFLLGMMMFSVLALALASIARSVHEAAGITQILYATMIILCGGPVSYEAMPGWLQKIALLFPATYYILSLRESLTGIAPANIYSPLMMVAFLLLAATVSIKYFRWER